MAIKRGSARTAKTADAKHPHGSDPVSQKIGNAIEFNKHIQDLMIYGSSAMVIGLDGGLKHVPHEEIMKGAPNERDLWLLRP